MASPTPLVRALLFLWGGLWLLASALQPLGVNLETWLALRAHELPAAAAWPGVLGYALLHAPFPNLLHVLLNGLVLYYFGGEVEILYRGRRFLAFLALVVAAGAAVHFLFGLAFPAAAGAVIGGSGIVNAVLAVNTALYPDRLVHLILFRLPLKILFPVWLALDLLGAWYMALGYGYGVAADVHLAGALVGWLWAGGFGRYEPPWRRWRAQAHRRRDHAEARARAAEEAELDRILAKIGREGLPSLTPEERRFLERRSRPKG